MSGRGGIYDGPDGQKLYGDGREVEDAPMSEPTKLLREDETYGEYAPEVCALLRSRLAAEREKNAKLEQRYEKLALSESRLVQCEIELRNQIAALECDYADLENKITVLKAELAKLREDNARG